ncbi:hypothetical protein SRHO_G00096330 [Serrasalmus rhombeus]
MRHDKALIIESPSPHGHSNSLIRCAAEIMPENPFFLFERKTLLLPAVRLEDSVAHEGTSALLQDKTLNQHSPAARPDRNDPDLYRAGSDLGSPASKTSKTQLL